MVRTSPSRLQPSWLAAVAFLCLAVVAAPPRDGASAAPSLLTGYGAPGPSEPTVSPETWAAYRKAMVDSAMAEPGEVVNDLVVPSRTDPRTQWRTIDGQDHVLVGTIRRNPVTDVPVGERFTLSGDRWVSFPAELAARCLAAGCAALDDTALDLRLKQLLGLPPDADYGVISHFWIRVADLFRPCTDPRLTSTTCPPETISGAQDPPVPTKVGDTVLDTFLWGQTNYAWRIPDTFDVASAVSCAKAFQGGVPCYGFPWTRLGYTFDWTDDDRDVGVTELVAVRGATAVLEKVGTQREFFPRAPAPAPVPVADGLPQPALIPVSSVRSVAAALPVRAAPAYLG